MVNYFYVIKYVDYYPYIKKQVKKPSNIKYVKYWEEIQQDSSYSNAYFNLGIQLSSNESIVLPDNSKVTKRDLYLLAIKYNSSDSDAYYNHGTQLSSNETIVLPDNSKATERDLYLLAI